MEAYSQGDYTAIPSGTYGGTIFSPSYSSAIKTRQHKAKQHGTSSTGGSSTTGGGSTTTPGGTGTDTPPGGVDLPGTDGGTSNPINEATKDLTDGLADAGTVLNDTTSGVVTQTENTINGLLGALTQLQAQTQCTLKFALQPAKLQECLDSYGL
jgi:hypothetical protein